MKARALYFLLTASIVIASWGAAAARTWTDGH